MTDQDCRMGERCTMEGLCVVGAECVNDQECVATDPRKQCNLESFACEFREGFGDECDATRPCQFGTFCSTLLGLCLDSASSRDCTRRAQCPTNQICDRTANKCIPDPGCYGDQFCETGEVCDLVAHRCRALSVECTSCILTGTCEGGALCFADTKECLTSEAEAACGTGETCDPLGRCVQCTNSDQCGTGLFCNVAIGRCESNVQCADDPNLCPDTPEVTCVMCELPEICDARTKRCQAPPMICESDIDCPNEQVCDLSVDPHLCTQRIPDCLNDLLEDDPRGNNTLATPALLDPAVSDFIDLKVCPGDVDWYRLDVSPGTYLTVDARFEQVDGDIDMQLFLADGRTLVDESRSVTDNERVEIEVGTQLTLLLKVFLAIPTVRDVPYRLVVARDPGNVCMDDSNEPDDGQIDAKQLLSDMPYEGRLCTGDPDWFVLRNVVPGTQIHTTLDFVDNLGDLELELYRAGQISPLLVSNSNDDDEQLTYDASFGGDFYLRVVGKETDTNVYTLRVELREGLGGTCLDDPNEPNDTPLTATPTSAAVNRISDLTLCAGDEDWFRVHLEPNDALSAELGFDPYADLDLKLYPGDTTDIDAPPIELSDGTEPREFLARRDFLGGDFLVRVHGHTQADISPYQLDLRAVPVSGCGPDRIDQMGRGDTMMDPFTEPFGNWREPELTLCTTDDDWFRAFLPSNNASYLRIHFIGEDNILDFELWQGTARLFSSNGQPFPDHREVLVTIPGNVGAAAADVHVVRTSGLDAKYSLSLDLVPVFGCPDDPYEPNDTSDMPSLAASSSTAPVLLRDGTLCASVRDATDMGDEDWYLLNPPAEGARIDASIEFSDGDLLMELFSPGAIARACFNFGPDRCYSDGNGFTEMVSFTATTTMPYLLRVSSIYSSPNVPIRPPNTDTPYELSVEYTLP
jgi:hypothetical protein